MKNIELYGNIFIGIGTILIWIYGVAMVLVLWIGSRIEDTRFYKAATKSLKFKNIEESVNGIRNDFEVYRNHRFGFKSKSIIDLCQELERKMKLENIDEDVHKLEDIILIFKDDYKFDDEKMNKIIEKTRNQSGTEEARELREYLIRLDAYNSGIIYEKERYFKDMLEKMERKKWVSRIGYIVGIIGSIASVYSIF